MNNLSKKAIFLLTFYTLLLFGSLDIYSQGKNEIKVTNAVGGAIAGVSVHIFTSNPPVNPCACFLGGCLINSFDQDATNKHGIAEFRGEKKNRPGLKKNTKYYASIDAKCTLAQQQSCNNNPQQVCSFSSSLREFTTDEGGKFTGFVIVK